MADETGLIRASIVLAGKFNPAIFSPAWFNKYGLISDDELFVAETTLVHPEVTRFSVEHLLVEVHPGRFMVQIGSDPIVRILDIANVVFGRLLPHTPMSALGINYTEHFKLDHWKRRVALGRRLAPVGPWGEWGKSLNTAKRAEEIGGMTTLVMQEIYPGGDTGGRRVEISPSLEIPGITGVAMSINDHRDFTANDVDGAKPVISLLEGEFEKSITASRKIVADMLNFAKKLEI